MQLRFTTTGTQDTLGSANERMTDARPRKPSQRGSKASGIQFVNAQAATPEEIHRERQLAKAHTAKVNIQRRQQARLQARLAERKSTRSNPRSLIPRSSETEGSGSSANTTIVTGSLAHSSDRSSRVTPVDSPDDAPLLRPVSPFFPGPATGSSLEASETAEYILNILLPQTFETDERSTLFAAFCQFPIIQHALHFVTAVHQDVLQHRISRSNGHAALSHKLETVRLIRSNIDQLDRQNVELVIFAIVASIRTQIDQVALESSQRHRILFVPHMPSANGLNVYGNTETIEAHTQALSTLINYAGGLNNLTFPALARHVAFGDLLSASSQAIRPTFSNIWSDGQAGPFPSFEARRLRPDGTAGSGFLFCELPDEAVQVFTQLSTVDLLMTSAQPLRLSNADLNLLISARNACQHRLLSLDPWSNLSYWDRQRFSPVTYEFARLVAILYSTGVVFPVSPRFGWHIKLLASLQQLLVGPSFGTWLDQFSELATWGLTIASIGAYRTRYRSFFQDRLRNVLVRTQISSWPRARETMHKFVWSDSAGEIGAVLVWDDLGLEST